MSFCTIIYQDHVPYYRTLHNRRINETSASRDEDLHGKCYAFGYTNVRLSPLQCHEYLTTYDGGEGQFGSMPGRWRTDVIFRSGKIGKDYIIVLLYPELHKGAASICFGDARARSE